MADGERVFVHFGEHGTACLDLDGNIVWDRVFDYGHFHGPGGSPVVVDNKLILSCDGGEKQFLVALDETTGKTIWQSEKEHIHPERFSGDKMQQVPENQPAVTLARIQSIRVDEICEQAAVAIAHLRGVIRRGCQSLPHFQRNYDLLRGLPMPSQNIALATLRLDNATSLL